MRIQIMLVPVFCLGVALAQGPPQEGVVHWPAAKLKGYASSLKAKEPMVISGKKVMAATEPIGNRGNYTLMMARRDENGEPEIHAGWNDIFVGQEGEGILLYGGKVQGGHETEPGETRGGKIAGGSTQKLAAGDIVIIPAGTPHQTNVDKGKSFTYLVIKVAKK